MLSILFKDISEQHIFELNLNNYKAYHTFLMHVWNHGLHCLDFSCACVVTKIQNEHDSKSDRDTKNLQRIKT